VQQAAQRIAHLHGLGAQLGRLAAGQEVGVEALDFAVSAGFPRALQAGGERRFEAADAVFEQTADPSEAVA
jgi:hypothetical protein